jgi:hypothetical protein
MDAIQKIKTWKVALSHLILSFLFFGAMITNLGGLFELFRPVFICLQPIFSLLVKAVVSKNYLFVDRNTLTPSTLTMIVMFVSVPVCSLFFGWLFANVVNRLQGFSIRKSPIANRKFLCRLLPF